MRFYRVPGMSLAVVNDGRIEWAKGYGVLCAGRSEPVTPETRFQAASVSKPVSSLGALALVEQGRLGLDAPVNSGLASWKLPENHLTRKNPVTLRRLLSHTAGINVHGFRGYPAQVRLPTLDQILDGLPPANSAPVRVEEVPGEEFRYSGGGMMLVQKLVEDATGERFAESMAEQVLRPLGMLQSTFQIIEPTDSNPEFATAHQVNGQPVAGRWYRYPESTAAGLWTTAGDLSRFVIELQESRGGKSNRVISRRMTEVMLTPQKETVGLGIFVQGSGPAETFAHDGANIGFRSSFAGFANRGQGIAVLANSDSADWLIHEIARSVAEAYAWPTPSGP